MKWAKRKDFVSVAEYDPTWTGTEISLCEIAEIEISGAHVIVRRGNLRQHLIYTCEKDACEAAKEIREIWERWKAGTPNVCHAHYCDDTAT